MLGMHVTKTHRLSCFQFIKKELEQIMCFLLHVVSSIFCSYQLLLYHHHHLQVVKEDNRESGNSAPIPYTFLRPKNNSTFFLREGVPKNNSHSLIVSYFPFPARLYRELHLSKWKSEDGSYKVWRRLSRK